MSRWSRFANLLRADRVSREIDEELESHLEEAIAEGRDPAEARRALGSALRRREESRDIRLIARLESLRADAVFGWRQLRKHPATSAAAILSLALAIGACTAAFRLIDAMLLRPLPVAHPERLYALSRMTPSDTGEPRTYEDTEYPLFRQMRAAVRDQAELLAITVAERRDLTFGSPQDMEKAYRQYVSGWTFSSFGLRPALGRLFTAGDDETPGAHPVAVLSHDYWTRRFDRDPRVLGRTFHMDGDLYEIVGVVDAPFTGTDTGTVTDVFVPTMMKTAAIARSDWSWFQTWVQLKPGVAPAPVHERLKAVHRAFLEERAQGFINMPAARKARFLSETLLLKSSSSGFSEMQKDNRRALVVLGVLVALVLLIACANVANLLTAQAASRAREMALRVSIGAGRARLVQLVLVESAWLALLATVIGGLFAWWSAPLVVSLINPPDNPARLHLPADWRVLGFGLALALGVTGLFGLAPALRASGVRPVSALKGGSDPHAWRRVMHGLIAAQVAFCVLVLFAAGLCLATFERLAYQPTGFSSDGVITLDTVAQPAQTPVFWQQVADQLRAVPGVDQVALASWPLLSANSWNGSVSINGAPPSDTLAVYLHVSPGWAAAMRIPFVAGRDFRAEETHPGVAIVNEAFVRAYFPETNPIGQVFEKPGTGAGYLRARIVGVVRDAKYRDLRAPAPAAAYLPFASTDATGTPQPKSQGTFIVRTTNADPLSLAPSLRRAVGQARTAFRVSTIRTQAALNAAQTVRERLLATLALFFASVALVLAGVGLYGVLDYSVMQRRRELGIRLALGARAGDIARRVTVEVFAMVLAGSLAGLALGLAALRTIEPLFYQVKTTDPLMLALPAVTMLAAALLAALPPVLRALRIDPVRMLRTQ